MEHSGIKWEIVEYSGREWKNGREWIEWKRVDDSGR